MTKIKAVDYLIKQLNKLGIEDIFGLPGDYNFKIVEAIERNKNVNWIGCTNELNAGYSADGYARIKGYGAVVTTYGVGELSAINAIAGSMSENIPVIKITGLPSTNCIKNRTLIHHNLDNADYKAFMKAYSNVVQDYTLLDKKNIKKEIDRMINTAIKTKKPVYIGLSDDICDFEIDEDGELFKPESDLKNLKHAADEIIKRIEKSKKPILLADILVYRYSAKNEINDFLNKTQIPSCSFLRGMDIIDSNTKNYLGVYAGKTDNKICWEYLNNSDCIIAAGTVISDLNTLGFDFKFDLNKHINIQSNFVQINGKKYKNVLIKDLINYLNKKINYKSNENLNREFKYNKTQKPSSDRLELKYFYPRLNEFLKENDIVITEVGLVPFGVMPMVFPKGVNVQNQILWGSIGWATPCAQGCAMADRSRRTILITGDGAHQLTAQEISTMLRNKIRPVIFVINNSGYTVERILCDDVNAGYNDIAAWNYSMLPKVFKGDYFVSSVKTNKELDKVLQIVEKEQKEKLCYIELMVDYLDIPDMAYSIAKHPQNLKNIRKSV